MWDVVIAVLITLVIAVPVSALAAINYRKKVVEAKIGNADEKAREIIDEALKTSEARNCCHDQGNGEQGEGRGR